MNLRIKVFLILFFSTTLLLVSIYTISNSFLLKGFVEIEDRQLNLNTERLLDIIKAEEEQLQSSVNAWSVWDESYNFALKGNPDFFRVNYLADSIFDVRFSEVIYFDLKGRIILSQDYDYHNRVFLKADPQRLSDLQKYIWPIHLNKNPLIPFSGLYSYNDTFDFFTMNPIYPGSGKGQPAGYMLVFRKFDSDIVKRFEKIIKFKLATKTFKSVKEESYTISFIKKENEVLGHITLPGILKRHALFIEMTMPRTIYLYGKSSIEKYLSSLALFAYATVFLIFFLFDRYIIKRIARLKKDLNEISKEQSEKTRVIVSGNDEISDLAVNINSTLFALDQKQMIINRSSKLTALGEMAASVAHEINSPLSVISGYSARIMRLLESSENEKENLQTAATKINNNVFRIDKIIKSLRVIARDSENDQKIQTTIGEIFDDVQSLCQAKLNIGNITLDLSEFNPEMKLTVRSIQLAQVLVNLINNSVDALENHEKGWIKITTKETSDEVIINVIDSGDLIPDNIAERMMEPFFTTKAAGKGTGLGLSISKGMIESHGGKFLLKTRPHTCFEIILPK
jgi:signal transduction histidine kinase